MKNYLFSLFLCFIAGSLCVLAMAPFSWWPVLFIGLSVFYGLLCRAGSAKGAFGMGFIFGFGYFLFGLYWVGNALLVEGNPYLWAWPLAVCGLPFILSFFPAIASWLAWRFTTLKSLGGYIGFVGWLSLFEWLRGHLFTGFPWNLFGYSWVNVSEMTQITSIGYVYFLSALTILWATAPAFLYLSPASVRQKFLVFLTISLSAAACYGYGAWRLSDYETRYNETIQIRVVHPNIAQHEKWDRGKMAEHFFKQIRLSYPQDESTLTTYIIWPETALSSAYANDPTAMNVLKQALQSYEGKAYLLTGMLRYNAENETYGNSIVMVDAQGEVFNIYDKHHLVPFGEYIPFQKWIPLGPVNQFSGFVTGDAPHTLETPEGIFYSPLVCYEAIFPGQSTTQKPRPPDMLINATNDGWYGKSAGPQQHFVQTRFRAIEEGIPMIRSANAGISAIIDPTGKVLTRAGQEEETTLTSLLPLKISVLSRNMYFKNAIFFIFIIFSIAFGYIRRSSAYTID